MSSKPPPRSLTYEAKASSWEADRSLAGMSLSTIKS